MNLSDLTAELLGSEARHHTPFGLYVLAGSDPRAELARSVERDVFFEVFGNTAELMDDEYGPYEVASIFLLIVDHRSRAPAGMIRVITPSPAGLKTLEDLERIWNCSLADTMPHVDIASGRATWDVATLAVAQGFRRRDDNSLVSAALYQGLSMLGSRHGVRWVIATLDLVVLELVQTQCAEPFRTFVGAEPREYLDSPASVPVFCDATSFQQRIRRSDPLIHAFLFEGAGFERQVSPPAWDDVPFGAMADESATLSLHPV